ncbi:hypothetical protein F4778DRAFT_424121 [Xylariomycetidae sp. FL2044]|nr:hypothetical protein F4778DRAFT_424121 [Xylariomycetidae sp. FL2044]
MPSRLQKHRPRHPPASESSVSLHQDIIENEPAYLYAASNANLKPKLAPHSFGAFSTTNHTSESRHNRYTNSNSTMNGNTKFTSTIRTVPSFEVTSDTSSLESPSARNSGFSSSINSNVSGASYISQHPQTQSESTGKLKPHTQGFGSGLAMSHSTSSFLSSSDATARGKEHAADAPIPLQSPDPNMFDDQTMGREGSPQWDGAVGKAGLGKTGRVINKLVADNDSLKRDLKLERLKAEESKQAAKLLEDKMERMVSDYESRLLEANVTKTLLSRKERQVESLQSAVGLEKKRTADAQDRERMWREEMEKSRRDTKVQVEEANNHAALMEGRYNAISSHWRDQGEEVKRAMVGMNGKIGTLIEERRKDDDKINTLRDLCDQQDGNIRDLRRQKDDIDQQFEAYKREQEDILSNIKSAAREREEQQQKTIEETKEVLNKLKWALNVHQNVNGAQ